MSDIDSHKLMFHPDRVLQWLNTGDCFPIYVEIGPTNRCNHKCSFCALDFLKRDRVDISELIMINCLQSMASNGVKSIMFAGEGEPFLHLGVPFLIEYAKTRGIDISVTTNASCFDKSKQESTLPYLTWIRASLDAGTKKTHSKMHGVNESEFDKVIENLKSAVNIKRKNRYPVTIGTQFLMLPENIHEAEQTVELVRDIGVDNIQFKPYSQHPLSLNKHSLDHSKLKDLSERLKLFETDDFKVHYRADTINRLNSRDYKQCYGSPFFALIDAKGNVIPCTLYYNNPEYTFGNINDESFEKIWKGEKRKTILEKIKKNGVEHCRYICRLDPINRYLARLKNPHPHDNFV